MVSDSKDSDGKLKVKSRMEEAGREDKRLEEGGEGPQPPKRHPRTRRLAARGMCGAIEDKLELVFVSPDTLIGRTYLLACPSLASAMSTEKELVLLSIAPLTLSPHLTTA